MNSNFLKLVGLAALGVIALAAVLILVWGVGNTPQQTRVIQVGYLPTHHSLPLFVAVDEGFFEEEGLKVELQRIESPKDIIDGLVSGAIDAGPPSVAAGISAVVESKSPGKLKVYALNCSYKEQLVTEVLVSSDSNLVSVSDLKGKKIAYIPGVQWATMTKKALLANGVNLSDVTLIELPFSNQLPSLASHNVDAVFTLEPTGTFGLESRTAKILKKGFAEIDIVNPWCGGVGALSSKFISNDPLLAKKFVSIMNRAMVESETNPAHRKYLVKYLQLPESAVSKVELPHFYPVSDVNAEVLSAYQDFADLFFEFNVMDRKINVQDLMWDETDE